MSIHDKEYELPNLVVTACQVNRKEIIEYWKKSLPPEAQQVADLFGDFLEQRYTLKTRLDQLQSKLNDLDGHIGGLAAIVVRIKEDFERMFDDIII